MKRILVIASCLWGVFHSIQSHAATFTVTNSLELQTALTSAASNGEDNTINVSAGSYVKPTGFTYAGNGAHSLVLAGADKDTTSLTSFTGSVSCLLLDMAGPLTISGISFHGCGSGVGLTDNGTGIESYVVDIHDCDFSNNAQAGIEVDQYNNFPGSLTLSDNSFVSNVAGGLRVFSYYSFPVTLTGNVFTTNVNSESGGGAEMDLSGATSPVVLQGNTFSSNLSMGMSGGGLYIHTHASDSPVTLSAGNSFDANGAPSGNSGAIYIATEGSNSGVILQGTTVSTNTADSSAGINVEVAGSDSSITIGGSLENANTFESNTAVGSTGAVRISHTSTNAPMIFSYNTVSGNGSTTSSRGAIAIDHYGTDFDFSHNVISGNHASGNNGAFQISWRGHGTMTVNANLIDSNAGLGYASSELGFVNSSPSTALITNNVIINNHANNGGGGLNLGFYGSITVDFTNNTLANNQLTGSSGLGGGVFFDMEDLSAVLNVYNNIFWGNTVPTAGNGDDVYFGLYDFSGLAFENNDAGEACVYGGGCNSGSDFSNISDAGGSQANNLSTDPLFVDTATGDFSLQTASPAVQAGSSSPPGGLPAADFNGNPMDSPAPDMGAYQFFAELEVSPSSKDFGTVSVGSSSEAQTFTLSNHGNKSLSVSSIALSDTANFTLNASPSANPCGATPTLAPSGSCDIAVTFNPTAAASISANLVISSSDSASSTSIPLSGTADSSASAISISIQGPSGTVEVGSDGTFEIQIANSSGSASENNTLSLIFQNMNFESGSEANASMASQLLRALRSNSSNGVSCAGSGSSAACSIATIPANSTLVLNVTAKATAVGPLSLTASLTNQAGSSIASGSATATGVSPSTLDGGGCSIGRGGHDNHFADWIFVFALLLAVLRARLSLKNSKF